MTVLRPGSEGFEVSKECERTAMTQTLPYEKGRSFNSVVVQSIRITLALNKGQNRSLCRRATAAK